MSVLRYCAENGDEIEINNAFSMLLGMNLSKHLKRRLKTSAMDNKVSYIYLEHLTFQLQLSWVSPALTLDLACPLGI